MDRRLREVDPRLGHADQLDGLRGGGRGQQRGRVGQPDVLAGVDDQPAGDEPRVLAGLDHPGEVVQRGVGVRAADRLDERADDVVVLVAVAVVAHRRRVDRLLQRGQVDGGHGPRQRACARGRLQRGERAAGVAAGHPQQVRAGVVVEGHRAAEPALVGQRAVDQDADRRRRRAAAG